MYCTWYTDVYKGVYWVEIFVLEVNSAWLTTYDSGGWDGLILMGSFDHLG